MKFITHRFPNARKKIEITEPSKVKEVLAVIIILNRSILLLASLSFLVIATASFKLSAKNIAQSSVTLTEKNAPLEKVILAIEKQTGYFFIYNSTQIKQALPVTIDVNRAPLEQALNICFKNQPLSYTIIDNLIIVKSKVKFSESLNGEASMRLTHLTSIRGRVTNENGEPIAGVTVTEKGSKHITFTNLTGDFAFSNIESNASLIFSGANIETLTINIAGQTQLFVRLTTKISKLDEVQVIAYGTTTQRFATGNIGIVKGEDIARQPVNNPLLALEGRIPGLFIAQASGLPGAGVTVRIEGTNSITSGNDPFYVVDGVPFSQSLGATSGGITANIGTYGASPSPFNYINPSDIESVEVLKDADATAIYGSRAANGAILITTKKGKAGPTKLDLNLQTGWGQIAHRMDLLNTQQYLVMRREAFKNDNLSLPSLIVTPSNTDYDVNGLWDTTRSTDWQKTLIGGTAEYSNLNFTISGGTALSQYIIGGTYHRETTVFPDNFSDQKGSVHFGLNNTSANQKFFLQLSGNYMTDNNQLPGYDLTQMATTLPPDAPPLLKSDGTLNWAPNLAGNNTWQNGNHPLAYIKNTYQNKTNNLISNAIIGYKIFPGLEIKSSLGYTNLQGNELTQFPSNAIAPEKQAAWARYAYYSNSKVTSWTIEPQLNYKHTFKNGKLDILAGSTIYTVSNSGQSINGSGYSSDALINNLGAAATASGSSTNSIYKYNALFGRINYNMWDKYLINFTTRRDGSSRFGDANKFHNFWGIGIGWIFTQENLLKRKLKFLNFGKIRASYGTTGNDQIGDYKYYDLYNVNSVGNAYQGVQGLRVNAIYNPYLQWEETKKLQAGLELGFFKERILANINYVYNRSSNQLLGYTLPTITGFSAISSNFPATVQNSGWELTLNTVNIKSKFFSWTSSVNLSLIKNKLAAFENLSSSSYKNSLIIGQPLSIIKLYHFLNTDPNTGIYYVSDSKGTPTLSPNSNSDKTVNITTYPEYYGGFQNSFNFKGLELNIMIQYVRQSNKNISYNTNLPGFKLYNQPSLVLDRRQHPGDNTLIPNFTTNNFSSSPSYVTSLSNFYSSDAYYSYDASYIRVKNISLSYQISSQWTKKAGLNYCSIYVQGQNLATITQYKGLDPENQSVSSLPPLRILTIGLKAGL